MNEKILKIDADTSKAVTSIKDLRNALKETKDAMAGLEEGSEQWLKLAAKAGEYQHQIQAVGEAIRGASSDFGDMLGNVSKVGAGITGAFQTASAAMSMFGVESEDVTKSIKTMQNMMAMTQGLASIDAMIKSLGKLSAAIKGTTTVAKIFRAALQPKTFLAISAAIGALTLIWNKFGDSIKKSVPFIGTISDKMEDLRKKFGDDDKSLKKAVKDASDEVDKLQEKLDEMEDKDALSKMNEKSKKAFQENQKEIQKYQLLVEQVTAKQKLLDAQLKDGTITQKEYKSQWTELNEQGKEYLQTISKLKNANADIKNDSASYVPDKKKDNSKSDAKYQLDYDVERAKIQKEINKGTQRELDLQRTLIDLYQKRGAILSGNVEEQRKLTKAQIEANDKEIKQAKTQLDIENAKNELANIYVNRINNEKDSVDGLVTAINKDFSDGYLSADAYFKLLINSSEKYLELQKTRATISNSQTGFVDGSIKTLKGEYNYYKKLLDEINNKVIELKAKGEDFSTYANLGVEYMLKMSGILNQIRDKEYEMAEIQQNVNSKSNLEYYEARLKVEEQMLARIEEGSLEWWKQKQIIEEIKQSIRDINEETLRTNIDLQESENFQWQKGGIEYLKQRIEIEEEVLQKTKEGTLEYKQQQMVIKGLQKDLLTMKLAAANVASQGIGFISDALGSLADMQDTTTREGFEKQKNLQVSSAVMNAIGAGISAWASWMNPANAWMTAPVQIAMATLQTAALAAALGAQIKQIQSTTFDGGGSISSASVNSLTLVPPTQYSSAVQNANIEETVSAQRSYVAVTEIERVGNRVSVAEQESRY